MEKIWARRRQRKNAWMVSVVVWRRSCDWWSCYSQS